MSNFSQALLRLKEGKKVHRVFWSYHGLPPGEGIKYFELDKSMRLHRVNISGKVLPVNSLHITDIMAEDWKVYEH